MKQHDNQGAEPKHEASLQDWIELIVVYGAVTSILYLILS